MYVVSEQMESDMGEVDLVFKKVCEEYSEIGYFFIFIKEQLKMIILLRCVFEGKDELEIEKIWDIKYLVCICIRFILKKQFELSMVFMDC